MSPIKAVHGHQPKPRVHVPKHVPTPRVHQPKPKAHVPVHVPVKTPTPPVVPAAPKAPVHTVVPGIFSDKPLSPQAPGIPAAPSADHILNASEKAGVTYKPGGSTPESARIPLKYEKPPGFQVDTSVSSNRPALTTIKATASLSADNAQRLKAEAQLYGNNIQGAGVEYENLNGLVNRNNTGGKTDVGYYVGGGVRNTRTDTTNTTTTEERATVTNLKDGMSHSSPFMKSGSSSSTSRQQELLPYGRAGITATTQLSPQTRAAGVVQAEVQPGGVVGSVGARVDHKDKPGGDTTYFAQGVVHQSFGNEFATGGKTAYGVSAGVRQQLSDSSSASIGILHGSGAGSGTSTDRQRTAAGVGTSITGSYSQDLGSNATVTPFVGYSLNGGGVNAGVNVGLRF